MARCLEVVKVLAGGDCSLGNLKLLCKSHLAYCAVLSQQNRHGEALDHAKYGAKYAHAIINRVIGIAEGYAYGTSDLLIERDGEFLLEGLAKKLLPILYELRSMLGVEGVGNSSTWKNRKFQVKTQATQQSSSKNINMRNLFGYCKVNDWCANVNISSVMQLSPLTFHDLLPTAEKQHELCRESVIEDISYVLISYFCISTEKRFTAQSAKEGLCGRQAEFWHAKALELACCFLPLESPLVSHIYSSYQKNYSALQCPIVPSLCSFSRRMRS